MWLLAEDWQVIIYRFMYRWINTWLNVVEHVMIEYRGMMSWLSVQHSSWRSTTQCNMRSWVTINRLVIVCNEWCLLVWLILAVCAETNFISVKMSFAIAASATLCGATQCATTLDQVQQSLWGSRTSHPLDFNGGMTRRIISTFGLAEPAIAMLARKRAPKSSAPYCRLVVGTPDVHR